MRIAVLSLGLLAAVAASVGAEEESIKPGDLPKAVASAVKARYPKGEITKAVKEEEHGKTIYEVIVKVEGKTLEVALSARGKILEVEQAIAAEALPRAVAAAIAARYPAAKIKKAERIVKFEDNEEETTFEVVLATEGKRDVEVELSPEGKILEDDEDDRPGEKKDKD